MKIEILKPKCQTCGYIPMESWDRICPRDKSVMRTELVEVEI